MGYRLSPYYARPDVRRDVDSRMRASRRLGITGAVRQFAPKAYWDFLYYLSPRAYYDERHGTGIAYLCKLCDNEHCGWAPEPLPPNPFDFVCKHCRTSK